MNNMDSYICKAKREDNGEWVEGYFTMNPNNKNGYITDVVARCAHPYRIDVSTICKCSGRRDSDNGLIFEGDILSFDDDDDSDDKYTFVVEWGEHKITYNISSEVGYIGFYLYGYGGKLR